MNVQTMIKKEYKLNGLCCAVCAEKIRSEIHELEGVDNARLDMVTQKLVVSIEPNYAGTLFEKTKAVVKRHEPDVEIIDYAKPAQSIEGKESFLKKYFSVIALCLGAALFAVGLIFNFTQNINLAIFITSYLLTGGPVVLQALRNISQGQVFDENFLMSIASIGAFAIGDYAEGVAVMLFYRVGEAFQDRAVDKSRRSITALMDIRPDSANLLDAEGNSRVVSPDEIVVGDLILVKPGERIPLDGVVISGYAAIDTSALTGESLPRDVEPGSEVLSGSINKNGLLTIRAVKLFAESTVSKILELVENAAANKAVMENFITKFARYYTPVVVFAALALAVFPPLLIDAPFSEWLYRALVFLVISCPCALVISVPLSFFGGIGGASRKGILVKGGNYLEALNNVDTVIFDKTGTITAGVFEVAYVGGYNYTNEELLFLAASAESHSNHPIALSIQKANTQEIPIAQLSEYEEIAGKGVRVHLGDKKIIAGKKSFIETFVSIPAQKADRAGTYVHVAVNDNYAGYIVIADSIKNDSALAVRALKNNGVRRVVMLTGDSSAIAHSLGQQLGFDEVFADLLPEQKVEHLERLEQTKGRGNIVFVGDGINDAPVLARSDVGIAMGALGADAAIEAADVVIMTDEPSKVALAIGIARKTRSIVTQNVVFALGVKAVLLVLGAMGLINMWVAVFGDVGVALLAIMNAMRAMFVKEVA